jgi:hypothetical protein
VLVTIRRTVAAEDIRHFQLQSLHGELRVRSVLAPWAVPAAAEDAAANPGDCEWRRPWMLLNAGTAPSSTNYDVRWHSRVSTSFLPVLIRSRLRSFE